MIQRIIKYLKGVQFEMIKVSWPKRDEVTNATTLVVVFSIAFAVVVWVFDLVLNWTLGLLLGM
jgi:preprotein translocase SecE subunit